jgi:hypothetical protein
MLRGTYLELQFSKASLIELVRTNLVMNYPPYNPVFPPSGEALPTADDGTRFVVLSTAFLTTPGATTLRHGHAYTYNFEWSDLFDHNEPVPARRCEVTQRVRVDVARRETRKDGQQQDIEVQIIDGTLIVDLSAFVADNVVQLNLDVKGFNIDTPDVDPRLAKVFQQHGLARFFRTVVPLQWGPLLGQPSVSSPPAGYNPDLAAPHVQNCGAAFADDLSTFALRTQFGGAPGSGLISEWIEFFAGHFPNRLRRPDGSTAQWGTLLSSVLVESLTRDQIEQSLAAHADDFRLLTGVGAHWAPNGSEPRVYGSFDGTVLIFCRPSYHVTFDGRLDVTSPNNLTTTSYVDWDGNNIDLALCEAEAALAGGIVGAVFGSQVGGPLGGAVGFVVGLGVGFIGGITAATVYTPDLATKSCTQDGRTQTCTRVLNPSLQLGPGLALPVQLTSAAATDDGLEMTGTYQLPLIPALQQSQVVVETKPFGYTPLPVNCGNLSFGFMVATTTDVASFTHAEATITVRWIDDNGVERKPLAVTVALVSPDPENVFPPASFLVVPLSDRTVIHVRPVLTQTTPPNYWIAPYGCTVRVDAVVATRTVVIPAPSVLSAADKARLHARALQALSDCLAKQSDFGKKGGRAELEWLPDPYPDQVQTSHLWQVGVLGLDAEEQLQAESPQGQLLASSEVDAQGSARLIVLTPGGRADRPRLVLHRVGGDLAAAPARRADIRMRQTDLVPHGLLLPGGLLRSVSTRATGGRLLVAVASTTTMTVYDVTFPSTVRGYLRADATGVLGMTLVEAGLVSWGVRGLTVWSLDGVAPRRIVNAPVHAVRLAPAGLHAGLIALTDEQILGVSRDGARTARLASRTIGTGTVSDLEASFDTESADTNATRRFLHAAPEHQHHSRASASSASYPASPHGSTPYSPDVVSTKALEYYVLGSTMLIATADGAGLQLFSMGRTIEA